VTLVAPNPVTGAAAAVLGGVSVATGGVATAIDCLDGGGVRSCLEGTASTALSVGTFSVARVATRLDDVVGPMYDALTGAIQFVVGGLQHARDAAMKC
jgi:hypothetical protein